MNKAAVNWPLLQLLVKVYNQTVQSYHYFPDVIICGRQRLEKVEFDTLVYEGFLEPYYADSFGRFYRLSAKAHQLLHQSLHKRRGRAVHALHQPEQACLPF